MAFVVRLARRSNALFDQQQHLLDDQTFDLAETYGNPLFLSFCQKASVVSLEHVAPTQNAFSIMMASASVLHWYMVYIGLLMVKD